MTFMDWSDSEGMLDLLTEFIRSEMNVSYADAHRQDFLTGMLARVEIANQLPLANAVNKLRGIRDSIEDEFRNDPVFLHMTDLIVELERIA